MNIVGATINADYKYRTIFVCLPISFMKLLIEYITGRR
jgi:hypothetical protein